MSREKRIISILEKAFDPKAFEILNESHLHSGPRTESHYKVFLVSDNFKSLNKVERQQAVYSLLKAEFDSGMHALSLRLKTPEEVKKSSESFVSPNCKHQPK